MNAIELSHVTKHFPGFTLQDLSLTVPSGTICGLVGENGAGKSTTIRLLMGALRPDSGTCTVLGADSAAPEFLSLKEDIGVVLDEASFHDPLKAPQVGRILSGAYRNWDQRCFDGYLDKFGLPRDKKIKDFSKGMRMKLSIATALSHHPRLLLLDEPTSGLDPVVRNELLDEFLDFIQDEGRAILLSSHITSDLEKAADYVTYLHRGRVAVQGAKDELLESYGRLACARSDLQGVDPALLVGARTGQFGCEALVRDRRAFRRQYPALTVDPVTLEDIMVFTVRGDEA